MTPRGAQVRRVTGSSEAPDSSQNTIAARRRRALRRILRPVLGDPAGDRLLVALDGAAGRALQAPAHAAQQLPGVAGMVAGPGQLLDHAGDAGQGPVVGAEAVRAGTFAERLVDGGTLGLRQARGRPGRTAACQRRLPAGAPQGVPAAGVLPRDTQLVGDFGLGATGGKQLTGLHADVFERLAVTQAAGVAAVGGWSHAAMLPGQARSCYRNKRTSLRSATVPKQHYLPAAHVGRFSIESSLPIRARKVWVMRRDVATPFLTKAGNVACENNLFEPENQDGSPSWMDGLSISIDEALGFFEPRLPDAVDELIDNPSMDALLWANTLIPFVVSLFVRGPEFYNRFGDRVRRQFPEAKNDDLTWLTARNNTLGARLIESHALLPAVKAARWRVMHNTSMLPIVTSDLGYALAYDPFTNRPGYVIPLRQDAVLVLERGQGRLRAEWLDDRWKLMGMRHEPIPRWGIQALNDDIADTCLKEVYGPSKDVIGTAAERIHGKPRPPAPIGPWLIGPPPKRAEQEQVIGEDYFSLLTILSAPPKGK